MKNNLYVIFSLALFVAIVGCQGPNMEYVDLSNEYRYLQKGGLFKKIESKRISYHNAIYPTVSDYVFNEQFILAEQMPDRRLIIAYMGEDFLRRFEHFRLYKNDTAFLSNPFYTKLRGIVEKDSLLYNSFLAMGSSDDESNNRAIGIRLAEKLVAQNERSNLQYYKRLNYWIIAHSNDTLFGPLTKAEYLDAKNVLGVPRDLKLKFEKK